MGELLTKKQVRQFEELLKDYSPHQELLGRFEALQFGVIMGPAGSGKDTLREELLKRHPETYHSVISDTSRPKRPHETEGVEYHFKSAAEMVAGFKSRDYLQGQIVHGQQLSGMHGNQFLMPGDKIALSILVVQTEAELHKLKADMKSIFLVPPSYDALLSRVSEKRHMTEPEKQRRLQSAVMEIRIALETARYYCVTSHDIDETTKTAHAFFELGTKDTKMDASGREILKTILERLEAAA